MGCALEPYLRVYTADMQPQYILEFLLLDEDFPRSVRFCTARIEEHLSSISRHVEAAGVSGPDRLAGRLRARLQYAEIGEVQASGSSAFLGAVLDECADSDCSGCCTQNQGSTDELIDVESFTYARFNNNNTQIKWADLGPTTGSGCN